MLCVWCASCCYEARAERRCSLRASALQAARYSLAVCRGLLGCNGGEVVRVHCPAWCSEVITYVLTSTYVLRSDRRVQQIRAYRSLSCYRTAYVKGHCDNACHLEGGL